jgi:hypothetical protein
MIVFDDFFLSTRLGLFYPRGFPPPVRLKVPPLHSLLRCVQPPCPASIPCGEPWGATEHLPNLIFGNLCARSPWKGDCCVDASNLSVGFPRGNIFRLVPFVLNCLKIFGTNSLYLLVKVRFLGNCWTARAFTSDKYWGPGASFSNHSFFHRKETTTFGSFVNFPCTEAWIVQCRPASVTVGHVIEERNETRGARLESIKRVHKLKLPPSCPTQRRPLPRRVARGETRSKSRDLVQVRTLRRVPYAMVSQCSGSTRQHEEAKAGRGL